MKKFLIGALCALVALLASCGGGGPEPAAQAVFEAMKAKDAEKMMEYIFIPDDKKGDEKGLEEAKGMVGFLFAFMDKELISQQILGVEYENGDDCENKDLKGKKVARVKKKTTYKTKKGEESEEEGEGVFVETSDGWKVVLGMKIKRGK